MKSLLRNLALAGAVLCILAFLLVKTKLVDTEEHNRYVNLLLQLQRTDSALNENLMKARHAYLVNYDPIVQNLQDLKVGTRKLQTSPGFLKPGSEGYLLVADQVRELQALVEKKETLVDRFKSENSILRNSLSFFPVAAGELIEVMDTHERGMSLGVQALLRDTLMYNLHSNSEILPRIQGQIEALSLQGRYDQVIPKENFQRILNHGQTILKFKASLDGVTREALELPTRPLLQRIQGTYSDQYLRMVSVTNNYRLILYLFAIVMSTAIAYSFLRLKNTTLALNEANLNLEKRVLERTEDLNQANGELIKQKDQLVLYLEELRAAQEKLHRISITDELTGLYTRRFLFEWMGKEIESLSRNTGDLSCMLLDVDFFKKINDTCGHAVGDTVLKHVAEVVRASVRQSDIVGRYGGEEFLILLPNTSLDCALVVAEKVRVAIEANIKNPRQITGSFGVGALECKAGTMGRHNTAEIISTLLESADKALYRAKEKGRNRYEAGQKVIQI